MRSGAHPPLAALRQFLGLCIEPLEVLLLAVFCPEGSLESQHSRLCGKETPKLRVALSRMHQLARGVDHMHERGFMHRDLKPANILVEGESLKIADFGLACAKPKEPASLTAETGSYRWMAPEVMRHEPYDGSCDVYSFGLVCWELLTYKMPFGSLSPVEAAFAVADKAKRPSFPDPTPEDISTLVSACWHQDHRRRPSFAEVDGALSSMIARHASPPPQRGRSASIAPPASPPMARRAMRTRSKDDMGLPPPSSYGPGVVQPTPRSTVIVQDLDYAPEEGGNAPAEPQPPAAAAVATRFVPPRGVSLSPPSTTPPGQRPPKRVAEGDAVPSSAMKRPNSISTGLVALCTLSSQTSPSLGPAAPPALGHTATPRFTLAAAADGCAETSGGGVDSAAAERRPPVPEWSDSEDRISAVPFKRNSPSSEFL